MIRANYGVAVAVGVEVEVDVGVGVGLNVVVGVGEEGAVVTVGVADGAGTDEAL